MPKIAVFAWLGLLLTGMAALFWYNEWKFRLPTPVPAHYHAIPAGNAVALPAGFSAGGTRPVFIHFFNPDCPCSKFNMKHFKSLVARYGRDVDFSIAVMSNDRYTADQIRKKFDLDLPVSFDTSLPRICGVYSTPQAVVLTASHRLYYRGNYNRTRYCTDTKTNYAEIALNGITHHLPYLGFDHFALTSYGCELPQKQD